MNLWYDIFAIRLNLDQSVFAAYGTNYITTALGYNITAQLDGPALDGYPGWFDI
jgi:hypothetical protein